MALSYFVDLPYSFLSVLFCVDSKATLLALKNADNKFRSDIIVEIKYMIHCLLAKGTSVDLCWVPYHCWLFGNGRIAKHGAFGNTLSHDIDMPPSMREMFNILETRMKTDFNLSNSSYLKDPRHLISLIYRLCGKALKTKYTKDVACTCIETLLKLFYQPITLSLIVTSSIFFL